MRLSSCGLDGDKPIVCPLCKAYLYEHGEINTKQGFVGVCPGDWIITAPDGEKYPCKPSVFADTYEEILPLAPADSAA